MKTKLSLFLATLVCWTSVAQPTISGLYNIYTDIRSLKIFDNQFEFSFPQLVWDPVCTKGTFSWVDDQFIEIHVESPKSIVDRSIKVTQTKSDTIDQLTVMLITADPYFVNAQIVCSTEDSADHDITIEMKTLVKRNIHIINPIIYHTAIVPTNTKKFYISLEPKIISPSHSRLFHSYLHYITPFFEVEEDVNLITIEIPEMKSSFWGSYVVGGDYVMVRQDTIYWRGTMGIKSKKFRDKKEIRRLEKRSIKLREGPINKKSFSRKRSSPDTLSFPSNLSGVYYDTTGRRLELFNDKFLFVAHPDSSWHWYDTIYAEATYSRINKQFIQLHEKDPDLKVHKNIEYFSMIDESKPDSIDFYLKLPNIKDLKIKGYIASITNKETFEGLYCVNFEYKGDATPIKLPPGKQILTIRMFLKEPIAPIPPDSVENVHFGPFIARAQVKITDDNTSQYTVSIPSVDPIYFGRYYVNGEFVRIKQDTLIWQGRTFVKSKLQRDIEYIAGKEAAQSKDKAPSSDRTTEGQDSPQATPPTRPKTPATE